MPKRDKGSRGGSDDKLARLQAIVDAARDRRDRLLTARDSISDTKSREWYSANHALKEAQTAYTTAVHNYKNAQ